MWVGCSRIVNWVLVHFQSTCVISITWEYNFISNILFDELFCEFFINSIIEEQYLQRVVCFPEAVFPLPVNNLCYFHCIFWDIFFVAQYCNRVVGTSVWSCSFNYWRNINVSLNDCLIVCLLSDRPSARGADARDEISWSPHPPHPHPTHPRRLTAHYHCRYGNYRPLLRFL